jgi:hypothetical protein
MKTTKRCAPAGRIEGGIETVPSIGASGLGTASVHADDLVVGDRRVELQLTPVGAHTLRLSVLPIAPDGSDPSPPTSAELAIGPLPPPLLRLGSRSAPHAVDWGAHKIRVTFDPLVIAVSGDDGRPAQRLRIDPNGEIRFALGKGPVFGLGQGGKQFDRRGGAFPLVNGQGEGEHSIDMNQPGARAPEYEFDLAHEGARVTLPWIVGNEGWAIFFHRPYGAIDLRGEEGRLTPDVPNGAPVLDAFLVVARDPAQIMREYATITGFPHLPPLWSLGYMQSRRTLEGREQVLDEAREFRRRQLPCDAFIYLGTGFTTGGWNTGHGKFRFNESIFPDPEAMIGELHDTDLRVALHVVDPPLHLSGTVDDTGPAAKREDNAAHYWNAHRPVARMGVDGWWPDVGDKLDPAARLARIRMYWDGPIKDRPDQRPFALHRNGYAGMQRYGWLWSGDVDSTWETLAMQVPVGINTGLSGIPVLGDRHRRLRHHARADRRIVRALVPVRRVLPVVPRARPHVEAAPAVGLEHRRLRARGVRRQPAGARQASRPQGAAQRRGRADLQGVSRVALPPDAVPLFGGARGARDRHADHARAVAALRVRRRSGRARRRIPVGPRHPGRAGRREGRFEPHVVPAARVLVRLLDRGRASRRARDHAAGGPDDDAALRPRRRDRSDGPGEAAHRRASGRARSRSRSIRAPTARPRSTRTTA